MLEILLLVWLGRKLAETAKLRGHSGWWAALGICFWIAGEILGFFLGGMFGLDTLPAYPIAMVLAALGAFTAYVVISKLPPGNREYTFL